MKNGFDSVEFGGFWPMRKGVELMKIVFLIVLSTTVLSGCSLPVCCAERPLPTPLEIVSVPTDAPSEQIEALVRTFYDTLASGQYMAAARNFAGDASSLSLESGEIAPTVAAQFKMACGSVFGCYTVRSLSVSAQRRAGLYEVSLSFSDTLGEPIEVTECCGEEVFEPITTFFCEAWKQNEQWVHNCLPLYIP